MRTLVYRTPAKPDLPPPPQQSAREFGLVLLLGAAAVLAIHMAFSWGARHDRRASHVAAPSRSAVVTPALERRDAVRPPDAPEIVVPVGYEGFPSARGHGRAAWGR